MDIKIEKLDSGIVKIIAKIDGDEWQTALNDSYNHNKGKYNVEGFRKGHAPRSFVEKKYGRVAFIEDAIDDSLQKCYEKALDENAIEPIDRPGVELGNVGLTECSFTITVPTMPTIKLGKYKGLTIEKKVEEVTEEMINSAIERERESQASWTEELEGEVKDGDTIVLDYSGSVDGVVFEGGTAQDQTLVIGSNTFIPGFESQLIGAKVGESKDITVKFPDDYQATELKGKDAVFACNIKSIKIKNLPELNDDFVKDISEFDTLDEYKADVKAKLVKSSEDRAETIAENELVDKIVEDTPFEVPEALIDREAENALKEFGYKLKQQGLNIDDYFKYTNSTAEDFKKQNREHAIKNVKIRLVLDEIIKAEKIEATKEQVNEKCKEYALQIGKKENELDEFIKTVPEQLMVYMENQVISDNLLAFLKANNKIG